MRLAEFGTVYRYEQSGELHGLTRVREALLRTMPTSSAANEQVESRIHERVIDLVLYVFKSLGFDDYSAQVSLRSKENKLEKYFGTDDDWSKAESAIIEGGCRKRIEYRDRISAKRLSMALNWISW